MIHLDVYNTVFWSSFFIILREGFEILLLTMIVYTTVEYKYKMSSLGVGKVLSIKETKRYMSIGIFLAVIFSFFLAFIFKSHSDAELYETLVFLTASIMLFYISIWCHNSSANLKKFNQVITLGKAYTLSFTVFVIFAREGFEIVMFYAALFADNPNYTRIAINGGACAIFTLILLYIILQRLQYKLPINVFFHFASLVMFLFAIYFGLKGMHEFSEINHIWWLHNHLEFIH